MKIHQNWNSIAFSRPPVAPAVGPFASAQFLETVWRLGPRSGGDLLIAESERALIAAEMVRGELRLVGHEDLVDYRSPLGEGTGALLADLLAGLERGTRFKLDSLPHEAVEVLTDGLQSSSIEVEGHTSAAVLNLPDSFDEYLTLIGKRERHELRRKRRRFEEGAGPAKLKRSDSQSVFEGFVALHRQSDGRKGSFMTDAMRTYFAELLRHPGWGIDYLTTYDGTMAAASFGFVDQDGYFLYNSAFDPDLRHLSPGQVMLGAMIERAISEGCRLFDFLKGEETYKFRLGAEARPLFQLIGVV